MHIAQIISINDGLALLSNGKTEEWEDIKNTMTSLDLELITTAFDSAEKDVGQANDFGVDFLNAFIGVILNTINEEWPGHEAIVGIGANRYDPARFPGTKNGVVVLTLGTNVTNGGDFANNIFIKIPYYYNFGLTEITVLLIPTEEAVNYITDNGTRYKQIKNLPTESTCREQLIKFGPVFSKAPIVIAFYSPYEQEKILIEEISSIVVEQIPTIERTIEFAAEFYQAGVGLLSYFGEILRQKDPNTKAKVRIEQEGNIVRLHIVPPVGEAEVVEKQLEQFALIISGQTPPEELLDNPGQIVQLKAQLRMAQMQIETAYDLKQLTAGKHAQDINNLEKKIDVLTQQVAKQVLQQGSSYELL